MESLRITKVITVHPEGSMKVWTRLPPVQQLQVFQGETNSFISETNSHKSACELVPWRRGETRIHITVCGGEIHQWLGRNYNCFSPRMHYSKQLENRQGRSRSHTHTEPCGHQTITNSVLSASIKRWKREAAEEAASFIHQDTGRVLRWVTRWDTLTSCCCVSSYTVKRALQGSETFSVTWVCSQRNLNHKMNSLIQRV